MRAETAVAIEGSNEWRIIYHHTVSLVDAGPIVFMHPTLWVVTLFHFLWSVVCGRTVGVSIFVP